MLRGSEEYFQIVDMPREKDQVWQQFTEIDVGRITRAQALLDNGHELRDAAITSWRGQSTKFIIFFEQIIRNVFFSKKNTFFGKKFPIPGRVEGYLVNSGLVSSRLRTRVSG